MSAWLWPDHVIGKRESRVLREEHNAVYNSHAELLEALRGVCATYRTFRNVDRGGLEWTSTDDAALEQAFAAIERAGG